MARAEEDWAWAAGLFEGEGCIGIRKGKYIRLQVETTDFDVLKKFQSVVGGTISGPKQRESHWKPIWHWQNSRADEVHETMRRFLPYLGERRTARWREVSSP